jgi:hypothetical protein
MYETEYQRKLQKTLTSPLPLSHAHFFSTLISQIDHVEHVTLISQIDYEEHVTSISQIDYVEHVTLTSQIASAEHS